MFTVTTRFRLNGMIILSFVLTTMMANGWTRTTTATELHPTIQGLTLQSGPGTTPSRLGEQEKTQSLSQSNLTREGPVAAGRGNELARQPDAHQMAVNERAQSSRLIELRLDVALLNKFIGEEFAAQNKIDEVILGTRAIGESVTKGQIGVGMQPSTTHIEFSLQIEGTCQAATQCTQQPIRFQSQTTTKFVGSKAITFHPEKGFESAPAVVEAESNSTYSNIQPLRQGLGERLIRRIAAQKIESSRGQAEEICEERTSTKISQMIDQRVEEKLADVNQRWHLVRFLSSSLIDLETHWFGLHTAEEHLVVSVGQPRFKQSPLILHWTAPNGLQVSIPREARVQAVTILLAEVYETVFSRAEQWGWDSLSALHRYMNERVEMKRPISQSKDSRKSFPQQPDEVEQ